MTILVSNKDAGLGFVRFQNKKLSYE